MDNKSKECNRERERERERTQKVQKSDKTKVENGLTELRTKERENTERTKKIENKGANGQ